MKLWKWSSEEKGAIVLEGLRGEKSVAEICREHQISQTIIGGGTGFWRQDRRG